MNPALLSSSRLDYETPWEFYAQLALEFNFTLDPCATDETTKCERWFTPGQDGLAQDWGREVVFMNPPYGREISKWMRKAVESCRAGATVVALVPARTDTAWWHDWVIGVAAEIRYVRGRIKFVGCEHTAPFPCAVVVYRP